MDASSPSNSQTIFCQGEEFPLSCESEQDLTIQKKKETFQHPKIYLTFGDKAEITCPYCSRVFYKALYQPL